MLIASRLKTVMPLDIHQNGNAYLIRSLYFDDILDRCMDENDAGVDQRQKFRIRMYGPHAQPIHLEIKEKSNSMNKKLSCDLTETECRQIIEGTLPLGFDQRRPLTQLQLQMRCALMRPKVIIEYERTAFVHPTGNVRITFDRNIMASRHCKEFFADRLPGAVPLLPVGIHVLEVKYDELLPDFIAKALEIGKLQQTAFSKYYLGRLAIQGEFPLI